MPSFRFTGLTETVYPFTRDAANMPLGAVEPGAVREFDAAPDQWWVPAEDGQDAQEPAAEQDGAPEEAAPEAAPEPQPAPPAALPVFVPPAVQA